MSLPKGDCLSVKISILQSGFALGRSVIGWECFNKTTQLCDSRVCSKHGFPPLARLSFQFGSSAIRPYFSCCSRVAVTSIDTDFSADAIIHSYFRIDRIVRSPTIGCTRIYFVILQVKVFIGIGFTENNLASSHITCDYTLSNEIIMSTMEVMKLLADFFVKANPNLLVYSLSGSAPLDSPPNPLMGPSGRIES